MTDEIKKVLSRADFLSASANRKRELIEVPELGGAVYLRELSARELFKFNERLHKLQAENSEATPSSSLELMGLMISMTACDAAGGLLFTEADAQALADNNLNILIALSTEALKISGVDIQ